MKVAAAWAGAAVVGRGAQSWWRRPARGLEPGRGPRGQDGSTAWTSVQGRKTWAWTAGKQESGLSSPGDLNASHQPWKRVKGKPRTEIVSNIHDRGLASRMFKELLQVNKKKTDKIGARVCSLLKENSIKEACSHRGQTSDRPQHLIPPSWKCLS